MSKPKPKPKIEMSPRDIKNVKKIAADCTTDSLSAAQLGFTVVFLCDWASCGSSWVTYNLIKAVADDVANTDTGKGCISDTYNHLIDKSRGWFYM